MNMVELLSLKVYPFIRKTLYKCVESSDENSTPWLEGSVAKTPKLEKYIRYKVAV